MTRVNARLRCYELRGVQINENNTRLINLSENNDAVMSKVSIKSVTTSFCRSPHLFSLGLSGTTNPAIIICTLTKPAIKKWVLLPRLRLLRVSSQAPFVFFKLVDIIFWLVRYHACVVPHINFESMSQPLAWSALYRNWVGKYCHRPHHTSTTKCLVLQCRPPMSVSFILSFLFSFFPYSE